MSRIIDFDIPVQYKELLQPTKQWRHLVYYGGRGGLKSHSVARALLIRGEKEKLRILCTRELQRSIKDSVHKLLSDLINEYELTNYIILKETIINTDTGTEFIFRGIRNNTTEIKSTEGVDICWCEEAHAMTLDSIDILTPTIRKPGSQIIWTFNRMTGLDPVYAKFVMNKAPDTYVRQVNYDIAESLGWFPEVLRKEMEADKDNPALYAHKWLGEPVSQSDFSILPRDKILNAMQRTVDSDGETVVGVDVARMGNDRTVFYKRKGLMSVDSAIYNHKRTTEVCDLLERFIDYSKKILIKVDDTGVGCITSDTSILTPNGWKYPEELHTNDIVYSKDKSGKVTETTIFSVNKRHTDIIEADGYKFAWAHQLPFKTRNEYKYKLGTWKQATDYKQAIFDTIFDYEEETLDFYMSEQVITMPNGGRKIINEEKLIDADEFAIFLGWYISEGSIDRSSKAVTITQKKEQHFDEIIRVMSYFGKVQIKRNGTAKDFKICNIGLLRWIEQNCYKGGFGFKYKTIPRFILNNSKNTIVNFLRAFRDGDGYIHKNGRNYYVTSSVNLVGDLMEAIYKIGKSSSYYKKCSKSSTFQIEGRTATRTEDCYVVYEYSRNGYGIANKQTKTYRGDVYSIILNNDTRLMFTKVDGKKPFWTHNGGVTDEMLRRGYNVEGVNFGGQANDKNKYPNWISEAWFTLAEKLPELGLIHNPDLLMELSTRQWKQDIRGRRQVESKGEYKKRGYRSPDLADAVVIAYSDSNQLSGSDFNL